MQYRLWPFSIPLIVSFIPAFAAIAEARDVQFGLAQVTPNFAHSAERLTARASQTNSRAKKHTDFDDPASYDFRVVVDDATEVELGLPFGLLTSATKSEWGTVWASNDKKLSFETLDFSGILTFSELYNKLITIKGRSLDKDNSVALSEDRFVLEGTDADGSSFHVEAHQKGEKIKGLSVTYSHEKPDYWPVVVNTIRTFIPFPKDARFIAKPCDRSSPSTVPMAANVTVTSTDSQVGRPIEISWSIVDSEIPKPTYLIFLLPSEVRFDGIGFYVLSERSLRNPAGVSFGLGQMRAIVPLTTALSAKSGVIEVLPYMAGPLGIEWAVISGGECERTLASGKVDSIAIRAAAPQILVHDEFANLDPQRVIRANEGRYEIHEYQGWFEVFEADSGALVLRRQGTHPTFSSTGRFLTINVSTKDSYEVIDLVAMRLLGQYDARELSWSHGDSFLYVEGARNAKLEIVRALNGARFDPAVPTPKDQMEIEPADTEADQAGPPGIDIEPDSESCMFCAARDDLQFDLSIDQGIVTFIADKFSDKNMWEVHDLGAHDEPRKYAIDQIGLTKFRSDFGGPNPRLDGWSVGERIWTGATEGVDPTPDIEPEVRQRLRSTGRLDETKRASLIKKAPQIQQSRRLRGPPSDSSSERVIGNTLNDFPVEVVKELRAPRDISALKTMEVEIAQYYKRDVAIFGPYKIGYGTEALPDPTKAVPKNEISKIDFTERGRDVWHWKIGSTIYWLTQTVETHRGGHYFHFSMLSANLGTKPRFVDLIATANDFVAKENGKPQANPDDDNPFDQFELGDYRTNPEAAFGSPSVVSISGGRYLIVATKPVLKLIAFDLMKWQLACAITNPVESDSAKWVTMHADGRHLTQTNMDGSIHLYECKTGDQVLSGGYWDNELVLMDNNGYFEGSNDAADYITIRIPGLQGRNILSQFNRTLRSPGIAARVLDGHLSPTLPDIHAPPLLRLIHDGTNQGQMQAFSSTELDYIQVYGDGRPLQRISVKGTAATFPIPTADPEIGVVTAFAVDIAGIVSAPITLYKRAEPTNRGDAYVIAVGVDKYPLLPARCGGNKKETCDLKFSAADASRVVNAVSQSKQYKSIKSYLLVNRDADRNAILSTIDKVISQGRTSDTIVISFAGHGLISNGRLLLGLSTTLPEDIALEPTSLSFDAVAEKLRSAKARVVVLLDVCHAGLSDQAEIASNDDAVARLVTQSGSSMIVFSASRGQQTSQETKTDGGGLFSVAFQRILTSDRQLYDRDGNGAISIDELYRALKAEVIRDSGGAQVPSLARNLLVGDIDLF